MEEVAGNEYYSERYNPIFCNEGIISTNGP
jgi:hypothetical protein